MALRSVLFLALAAGVTAVVLQEPTRLDLLTKSNLPIKPVGPQECFKSIKVGTPVVALLGCGQKFCSSEFAHLHQSMYLEELLSGVPELLLCEAGPMKMLEFVPQLVDAIRSAEQKVRPELANATGEEKENLIKTGYILNSKSVGFDIMHQAIAISERKPDLLIHLGDDTVMQMNPAPWYPRFLGESGLVVRQYEHGYQMDDLPKVLVAPYGYDRLASFKTKSCEAVEKAVESQASDRRYHWAFFGGDGSDMEKAKDTELITQLVKLKRQQTFPNREIARKQAVIALSAHDSVAKLDMSNTKNLNKITSGFEQSVFAPLTREGLNSNLEGSRIYTAMLSGAIPVVVGEPREIDSAFKYHNFAPILFANTWKHAREEMEKLLADKETLNAFQARLATWWCQTTNHIKTAITTQLTVPGARGGEMPEEEETKEGEAKAPAAEEEDLIATSPGWTPMDAPQETVLDA